MSVCCHSFVVKLQFIGCKVFVFGASAPSSAGDSGLCIVGCNGFFFPGFSFLSISGAGTRKMLKVELFIVCRKSRLFLFKQVRIKHR